MGIDVVCRAGSVSDDDVPLLGGRSLTLRARDGLMLPIELMLDDGVRVLWSTAEVVERHGDGITLRMAGEVEELALDLPAGLEIASQSGVAVITSVEQTQVRIERCQVAGDSVRLRWAWS